MKLYVLENVTSLTSSYHSGGGCVIVAADEAAARRLITQHCHEDKDWMDRHPDGPTDEEWANAIVYDVPDTTPRLFIFPDAGCC